MYKTLCRLLILDGNETSYIKNKETYEAFRNLVVEVTKAEKDIRFCSNEKCPCHPESNIKKLLDNKDLVDFLNKWSKGVVEWLYNWCDTYKPVVAKEIYED